MAEFDVIVIGMGPGGEEVAGVTAQGGLRVLGVERNLVGGVCPYWGCIPSKVIVRAGNALAEGRRIDKVAGKATVEPDYAPAALRVREVTATWDDTTAVERFEKKGGTFVRGSGCLTGPKTVDVDGTEHTATRGVVIATGTEPAIPPIDGLRDVAFWTNREAIEAKELPRTMVILGGGPIGLELGQAFQRFGTQVTVVEVAPTVLAMEEPENAEALTTVLEEDGMTLRTGVSAAAVRTAEGNGVVVELSDGSSVEGERLLVATGRKANLQNLGLETVGLDPEARALEIDDNTMIHDGLYAIGDITGKGAFTHVAVYQARITAAELLGKPHAPTDYLAVPRVTFTDPEIGSVGLSEKAAREKGIDVRIGVSETARSARGWIHGPGAEHGVCKLIADGKTDRLIGASVMSPAAGEILGYLTLALKEQIPVPRLREMIFPYPTFVRGVEGALAELGG